MEEMPFSTSFLVESSTLVVHGCIDELQTETFREALREASDDYSRDLVVDLSEVEFMPSLAVGVLVGAAKKCAASGRRLHVEARKGTIARHVLDICGLAAAEPENFPDPLNA
jgi:anti-anti-sigma factor